MAGYKGPQGRGRFLPLAIGLMVKLLTEMENKGKSRPASLLQMLENLNVELEKDVS